MTNICIGSLLTLALLSNIYGSLSHKRIFIKTAKPFLILLILFLYLYNSTDYNSLLISGLILGWIGDIFLIKGVGKRFTGGLAFFLMGHILYIIFFLERVNYLKDISLYYYLLFIVFLIIAIVLYSYLKNDLNEMKIPVLVYMACIMIMSFSAFVYFSVSRDSDFWFPLVGSLFFILSDSLLALSKFKEEKRYSYPALISTYVLAQLFISMGFYS